MKAPIAISIDRLAPPFTVHFSKIEAIRHLHVHRPLDNTNLLSYLLSYLINLQQLYSYIHKNNVLKT